MKVTLAMVASVDGKITEGDRPGAGTWASAEDQAFFNAQIAAHDCIVMGGKTYQAARHIIRPDPNKPRFIITRSPHAFAREQQPGLIFTADSPEAIVAQAKADGYASLLLVGGAETSARFCNARLVDELFITIEPLLFGSGTPFVGSLERTVQLKLVTHKQLNSQGTLLAHYLIHYTN